MKPIRLREVVGRGYDEFWNCKKFYRMVKGSKGSKKSKTAALWYIYNMMYYPDANTLVIKKIYGSLQNTAYAELLWAIDRLDVGEYWECSVSPLRIRYIPTGQLILFAGMDDALKLASITVPKGYLCWVWFEEFFDIGNEEEFNKIAMSIRGYIPPETGLFKQITGTFNPWSEHTWIKRRFFDKPLDDVLAITTTYKDNEFLGDDDIKRYEDLREQNPRQARIICDGEWGIAEGLIYENWIVEEFDYREILKNPNVKTTFGLDFGYKVSYNAFVAVLVDVGARTLWIYDEMYERGMTNLDIARKINNMGYGYEQIYADSAEPKSIFEIQAGLMEEVVIDGNIKSKTWSLPAIKPALKGADSIHNGISNLQSYRMIIHPKCENMIMELNNYAYDQDQFGNYIDKPIKEFDHLCDALRYSMVKFYIRGHGKVAEAKGIDGASSDHLRKQKASKRVVSSL